MEKTEKELQDLKEKLENFNKELKELSEEELSGRWRASRYEVEMAT